MSFQFRPQRPPTNQIEALLEEARKGLGGKPVAPHSASKPTVNLYNRIYACRGDQVEAVWPVKGLALS